MKLAKDYLSPGANKQSQLEKIRDKLEQTRFTSALFDTKKWVKSFKLEYRKFGKVIKRERSPENVEGVTVTEL